MSVQMEDSDATARVRVREGATYCNVLRTQRVVLKAGLADCRIAAGGRPPCQEGASRMLSGLCSLTTDFTYQNTVFHPIERGNTPRYWRFKLRY
jgi:hypothetical protein